MSDGLWRFRLRLWWITLRHGQWRAWRGVLLALAIVSISLEIGRCATSSCEQIAWAEPVPGTVPGTVTTWATWFSGNEPHESDFAACGGLLRDDRLTAAHRTLPCGTRLRVTAANTGRSVTVTVRDAGPWILEPDPTWPGTRARTVDWHPVYRAPIARLQTRQLCRALAHCTAPHGWRWRNELDLSRAAWARLGLHDRQGRAVVTIGR